MWDYTDKVKDHFLNPRNVGEIENPDAIGEVGNISCGDALKLTLKLDSDERIIDVKFKTFGCASAIASSSALTEIIKGKTLDESLKVTNQDVALYLGGLPGAKMHCSVMAHDALEDAVRRYRGIVTDAVHEEDEGKIVCRCFGVTDAKIRRVVMENNLKTIEEVTNYCKAGGACASCHADIDDIIKDVWNIKESKSVEEDAMKHPKTLTNLQRINLIQQIIMQEIRPRLRHDGGDIDLIDINGKAVTVALRGACSNCPSSSYTLREFVEKTLRERVSQDITIVEEKKN